MIFIDTGAFLARHVSHDQFHAKARRAWKDLEKAKSPLFTSNFVLDETFTLLARRTSYAFAADRAEAAYSSRVLTVLRPGPEAELEALALFRKLGDQEVPACVAFAVMGRHGLWRAFPLNRHFAAAGFTVWP